MITTLRVITSFLCSLFQLRMAMAAAARSLASEWNRSPSAAAPISYSATAAAAASKATKAKSTTLIGHSTKLKKSVSAHISFFSSESDYGEALSKKEYYRVIMTDGGLTC